jgi:hypothetical protein
MSQQVAVAAGELAQYDLASRQANRHRMQIREALGFRESSTDDEEKLAGWLAEAVCPVELSEDRLPEAVLARCRAERIEPPGGSRVERILGSTRASFERRFTATIVGRVPDSSAERLEQLADDDSADGALSGGVSFLAELKADPGQLGLETMLKEITKLERVRSVGLPPDLFADTSEKLLAAWRTRAANMYPSDFRSSPRPIRLTLLAALCAVRAAEITDGLVDLLIALVLKIDTRAERRVEGELINDLKRVRGKESILFRLAEAALEQPDETVRRALFPVVGEGTLRDLAREARAEQGGVPSARADGAPLLLLRPLPPRPGAAPGHVLEATLEFRSNNSAYRPVMDAIDLLRRWALRPGQERWYDEVERVPIDGVVPPEWREAVVDEQDRVERVPYELCVLKALRDAIRRRELYVAGAHRWRNPEDDLPADFELNRDVHYDALRQPLDAAAFVAELQRRHRAALTRLNDALAEGTAGGVKISNRRGEPWITVPAIEKQPEPPTLQALKDEVQQRWGTIDLLDVLKEADYLTGFTEEFSSVAQPSIRVPSGSPGRLRSTA